MTTAEIGRRHGVDHRPLGRAKHALDDARGVGAGHRVHRVELHPEAGREQLADRVEIEELLHELGIVGDRVDNLDCHAADLGRADPAEVDVRRILVVVRRDLLGPRKHGFGDLLGRRPAVADVVLDAEVAVGTAGIMARRENEPAERLVLPDHVARGRRREDAVLPDQHAAKPLGGGDLDRLLDDLGIEVAAVAADHQRLPRDIAEHVEDRLDEVLDIMRHRERLGALAQP